MEIIDKRQPKGEKLQQLRIGDIFDYCGEIYMKISIDIDRSEEAQNAFNLTENTGTYIVSDTRVRKLRGQLNIIDEDDRKPAQQDQPDAQQKEHRGRPRILDTGKVMALHNAGWDAKEIADEMNCTEATVIKYLREIQSK